MITVYGSGACERIRGRAMYWIMRVCTVANTRTHTKEKNNRITNNNKDDIAKGTIGKQKKKKKTRVKFIHKCAFAGRFLPGQIDRVARRRRRVSLERTGESVRCVSCYISV